MLEISCIFFFVFGIVLALCMIDMIDIYIFALMDLVVTF